MLASQATGNNYLQENVQSYQAAIPMQSNFDEDETLDYNMYDSPYMDD